MIEMKPGQVYGNWRVLETFVQGGIVVCSVTCICGNSAAVPSYSLRSGRSTQCRDCAFKNRTYKIDMESFVNNRCKDKYRNYKSSAKVKGLDFELDFDRFKVLILSPCYYCGLEHSNSIKATVRLPEFRYNGIDRTNNDEGYTFSNSVPCCNLCNLAKKALPYSAWDDWVRRLAKNYRIWGIDAN